MRVIILGGTGHIGTYLVPRLVALGHEVICVSRGRHQPYRPDAAWRHVQHVVADREVEEDSGVFGWHIVSLSPDIVIDLICFKLDSARHLVEALRGQVQQFLHCGTIWVHGHSVQVPTLETQPRQPFGEYGIQKAEIETYLLAEARRNGFPATVLHPGHIVGPGWVPLNPAGHFNPDVFSQLARGQELALPNLGLETVHHVHADDVAQAFIQAMAYWRNAVGESFHVVAPTAVTLRGYAETVATWFGQKANLRFLPWAEWQASRSKEEKTATWDHIMHSPNCSIAKAQQLLNYQPRYTSFAAVHESVNWLIAEGIVNIG